MKESKKNMANRTVMGHLQKINAALSDDEMESVAGGQYEDIRSYAYGYWIECPYCHNADLTNMSLDFDDVNKENDYGCFNCGRYFSVDRRGQTICYDQSAYRF